MAVTLPRPLYLRLYIKPSLCLANAGFIRLGVCSETANHSNVLGPQSRSFTASSFRARASPRGPLRSSHVFPQPILGPLGMPASKPDPVSSDYDLSCLPLAALLRNLLTSTVSSHPLLLNPALGLLSKIAYSENPLLSPTHNPLIHFILKQTVYAQFCGGETPKEVQATIHGLKQWGIQGVLLGWAREVEQRGASTASARVPHAKELESDKKQINEWIAGTRTTIGLVEAGDVVSIKFTGAGELNLQNLKAAASPSPTLAAGLTELCDLASSRGATIVIDAEQISLQAGIESWTLDLQRRYNRESAVVVGTYQGYLRKTPSLLARELAIAAREGFVLGIKLVRGAYLGSDPRDAIQPSKEDTDAAYDGMAAAVIRQEWSAVLQPPPVEGVGSASSPAFPRTRLILATHNAVSARKGLDLQGAATAATQPVIHAQLMGMADHVSCSLVNARRRALQQSAEHALAPPKMEDVAALGGKIRPIDPPWVPRPYKYLVWGTMDECLKYLVRRGEESRDAITRTEEGRTMLLAELKRRMKAVLGL